jgi:hypothetical protein
VTATVRDVAVTKVTAGPMWMVGILIKVTGGAILKCLVSMKSDQYGNNAPQTLTAIGIEHVATVFNIQAMTCKAELFVNLQHGFIVIFLFSICSLSLLPPQSSK